MPTHPTNRKESRVPGRGREPETGQREARRKGTGWVVALPAFVRRRLGITDPCPVYWHLARRGEAVLTTTRERRTGAPDTTSLLKELDEARRLVARLRQRNESRERALYAEGYAFGFQTGQDVTLHPHRGAALRQRRRRLWARAFPKAAAPGARPVEPVAAPLLDAQPAPDPPPSVGASSGGAAASEGEALQAAHDELHPQEA